MNIMHSMFYQTLLSGGNSSRLNKTIVDEKQLAVQVGAFNYALEDAGLFITFGIANMNVKPDALKKKYR
jgi:zinc protease